MNIQNIKVALISLGCDKNTVDSEVMLGALAGAAYAFTADITQAQAIIINTCGFLQEAVEEARAAINDAIKQKVSGLCRAIIVTGCAAQRYKQELLGDMPEIDAILGVNEYHSIVEVVTRALGLSVADTVGSFDDSLHLGRVLSTPKHYAYLKIAEGCDKKCTYCTIPKIRGPYKSRTMESLVGEARILAKGDVKELVLVAQDTTLYGVDIYGRPVVHELLRELSNIDGIHWLRLLYCYPEHIYEEFITEMATNPKVLPYIDMPIQHASDNILRLMGRRSTKAELHKTIDKLRQNIPGITLRTTLITGFPGETKSDFMEMCDFIKDVRFDRLGVFAYSREEGTPADELPDHLPQKTKENRKERLMKIQQVVSAEALSKKVGQTLEVLVEGYEDDMYHGRSYADAPDMDGFVYFSGDGPLNVGDFAQVRITKSTEYDLLGEVL